MRAQRSVAQNAVVIRNVILHLAGEQPMLADLVFRPQPSDVSLICTNMRTIDGKRPRSVESSDGVFVVPLATVRLAELPGRELQALTAAGASERQESRPIELPAPGVAQAEANGQDGEPARRELVPTEEEDIEPDEDLLRRIREV